MSYASAMTEGEYVPEAAPAPGRRRAEATPRQADDGLGLSREPRLTFQSRRSRRIALALALVLATAWTVWYALTPEKLPISDKVVSAGGVAGAPFYVGMFAVPDSFGRTVRVSGVKVHTTSNAKIDVTPLLCRHGTVGVTTQPAQFCSDLVNPEGQRLSAGDSIILKVEAAQATLAVINRLKIAYREDLRWDTQPAGNRQAIVTVAGRG